MLEIKKSGIKRASPDSIVLLERYFKKHLNDIVDILKEETITHGRKTLKEEDVKVAFEKIKRKEESWEI